MAEMDRADDFPIHFLLSLNATGVVRRIPLPRDCKLIKSYWVQGGVWDGGVAVKFAGDRGDLSETLSITAAGAAGTAHSIDHREESANNFSKGTVLQVNVTGESLGDEAEVVLAMRVL